VIIKRDETRIYYEVHGPVDGPAVLCTHGVAMDHRTFDQQVSALADRYRVIVWDMPGHGRSDPIGMALYPRAALYTAFAEHKALTESTRHTIF